MLLLEGLRLSHIDCFLSCRKEYTEEFPPKKLGFANKI